MSDKKDSASNAAADGELKLTAQETKLFTHIVKHLPKTVDIDWDRIAAEVGFKNAEVAKTRFRQIRTKLGIYGPGKPTGPKEIKPANENKITKPRRPAKPKKTTHVPKAEDDAKDKDMASDAQDSEI